MLSRLWGLPSATTNAMLQTLQRELERMQDRFGTVYKLMLRGDPQQVAQTPADEVYTEGKVRLLRYRAAEHPAPVPVLIVPSLMNRYYLLDLVPGRSLTEYLVGRGLDVFLLDWGIPGPEDRATTFDQYITGALRRATQRVRSITGQERISLLGYSMGGTFTAIFAALYGRYVANLVQLAAPIDFHDDGILSQWTRKERFNVDLVVDTLGAMPAALMQASFRMLKPTHQIAQQIALADQFGDMDAVQDFLALQFWLDDNIPFLGEAYRTYIKDCYQENYLVQGKLVVGGRRVDLSQIDAPLLTVVATRDVISPPASATVLNDLVASPDRSILELTGGHTSIVAGHEAATQLWPQIADWLLERSHEPDES
ncbi:MAG: alpha/beta fold hydrolase [Chloroflexi bacterium SZAS-1]|nr:alpha/beta fold hydrolase [Chloroflexi bacterium SZAS-1]HNP86569.1 alpha/beta fold hydrolase [Kouleothrix sp.]